MGRRRLIVDARGLDMFRMHRFVVAPFAGAVMVFGSAAFAGTAETLEAECKTQLGLSDSACTCIGAKAEAELNDKQQAMVVAAVTKDKPAQAEAMAQMTQAEAAGAANFMTTAPDTCANQ